jgi:acyl transferase domain-containing protein/acyl carrier protein
LLNPQTVKSLLPDYIDGTEIAIIGMAGRFPGARNIDEFWRNLRDGVESISFLSDEQLESWEVDSGLLGDPAFVRAAAVLEDAEKFDAEFFGFTPREAALMDPQHRALLEVAWETIEHAGYNPLTYQGAIGVFAGATINTYLILNLISNPEIIESLEDVQINIANGADFLTTRISYKLNLKGPSHLVQSACSTSLVAIHLACQSLLNEECDIALAGGVSINERLRRGYRYVEGGMVSPDGRCRAFDAKAQGTIFGSGVGMVALKRIADALEDRDTIHALIKGSAVNNDGSLKVGYTAPSVDGQAKVITEALANAGVDPESVTYIEAHGTGTPLGDPIEIQALTKAFSAFTSRKGFCGIGSVKTNIGHLDAAAGVTSLIKTVLSLKHKTLFPSLHFESPNPQIDFQKSPFYVNPVLRAWDTSELPRRAGVSAFGVGGTNAHVILEEAPPLESSAHSVIPQLLLLSARTSAALERATSNLVEFLRQSDEINLADLAYTLQVGRQAFSRRRALVANDIADAAAAFESLDPDRVLDGDQRANDHPVAFLFPGHDSPQMNTGADLYRRERRFREEVDSCCEFLKPDLGLDLREILYPSREGETGAVRKFGQTEITQPILFVIEYALARMWQSWGVQPAAMIGRGIGEYVAATLAGVIAVEDALKLMVGRQAKGIKLEPPKIPFISSMTGTWIKDEEATDGAYWTMRPRQTVRFADGVRELLKERNQVLLEVGPGQTLGETVKQQLDQGSERAVLSTFDHEHGKFTDLESAQAILGRLWLSGAAIEWSALHCGRSRRIPLPTYPFERERYWIETKRMAKGVAAQLAEEPKRTELHPRPKLAGPYVAPVTELERTIAKIWQNALGIEQVGTQDNFFDLGGDSLLAVQSIAQMRRELRIELPVTSLYEKLTIESLIELLAPDEKEDEVAKKNMARAAERNGRILRRKQYQEKQRSRREGVE